MDQNSVLKELGRNDCLELMFPLPFDAWFHLVETLLDQVKRRFPEESISPLTTEDAKRAHGECMRGLKTALANFVLGLRNSISSDSEDEVDNSQDSSRERQSSLVVPLASSMALALEKAPPALNARRSQSASYLPGIALYVEDDMESVVDTKPIFWKAKPISGLPSYATPHRGRADEPEVIDVEADFKRFEQKFDFTPDRRRMDQWEESSESEGDDVEIDIASVSPTPHTLGNSKMDELGSILRRHSSPRRTSSPRCEPPGDPWVLRKVMVPLQDNQDRLKHILNRLLQEPNTLGKKNRRNEDPRFLKAMELSKLDDSLTERTLSSPTKLGQPVTIAASPSVLMAAKSTTVSPPSPPSVVPNLNALPAHRFSAPKLTHGLLESSVGIAHNSAAGSSCFASPDSLPSNDQISGKSKLSMLMIPSPEPSIIDGDNFTEATCIAPLNSGLAKTGTGQIDHENPILRVEELQALLLQIPPKTVKKTNPLSPSKAVFPAHVLTPCGQGQPAPVPPPVFASKPKPTGISFSIGCTRPKLQPVPLSPVAAPQLKNNSARYTPYDSPSPVKVVSIPTVSPIPKVPVPPPPPKIGLLANRCKEPRPDPPSRSPSPSFRGRSPLPKAYRKEPSSTRSRRSRTRSRSGSPSSFKRRKESPSSTRSRRSRTRSSSSGRSRSRSVSPKRYRRRSRTPKRFKKRYSRRSRSRSSSGGRFKRRSSSRSSNSNQSPFPSRFYGRKRSTTPSKSRKRTPSPKKSVRTSPAPDSFDSIYFNY